MGRQVGGWKRARSAAVAVGLFTGVLQLVGQAPASAAPAVALAKSMPAETLYGEDVPVTLTATNTGDQDTYNLTFSDLLPTGTTLTGADVAPTSQTLLPDGRTLVVWQNVADLLVGTTVELSYTMDYPGHAIGDSLANEADAYVNTDPRTVPDVVAAGGVVTAGDFTQTAGDAAATELVPFVIEKAEPSPESELLRGVHDHPTTYTLTVRNNLDHATSISSVVDLLPAGLELLGCGGADNTTTGDEYPGAGPIATAPLAGCVEPSSVTTVEVDGDVYTRVEWAGPIAIPAGGTVELPYLAAVPLFENTLDFAAPGPSTANLDNNNGARTTDEQELTNRASATGTTATVAGSYTDTTTHTVTAEDVAIHKSVDVDDVLQGQVSTWTLDIESSEYALRTGPITVVDTVPDGIGYLGGTPAAQSVVDQPDGTQVVTWVVGGFDDVNGVDHITFQTETLTHYRATGGPVSTQDGWTNTVELATTADLLVDNDGTEAEDVPVPDASAASQSGGTVAVSKEVAEPEAAMTCGSGAGLSWQPDLAESFRPGDRVCWRLTVTFPTQLDTLDTVVRDFLPDGFTFESYALGTANNLSDFATIDAAFEGEGGVLAWDLGDIDPAGRTFQVVVASTITDPAAARDDDIVANLLKVSYRNTGGAAFQLRDQADVRWIEPVVSLTKEADQASVQAGDVVTYTITVTNDGGVDAEATSVRDLLPARLSCADVSNVDPAATCPTGEYLQWDGLTVAAGASIELSYDLTIPADAEAEEDFTNHAGVRRYENEVNTGGPGFEHVPADNVDPDLADDENTEPADDTEMVSVDDVAITKSQTTSVTETGNDLGAQATIGELVTYTVTVTIPEGSTIHAPVTVTDTVPSSLEIVGTPTLTLNGVSWPDPSVVGQVVSGVVHADGVNPYVNPPGDGNGSGDDVVVLTIVARVRDLPAVDRGDQLVNQATVSWADSSATPHSHQSNQTTTTVVEPVPRIAKASDDADGNVTPGQVVTYTLTVTNPTTGGNVSTAHGLVVTDVVPVDVVPLSGGVPAIDGQVVDGTAGAVWDADTRTLNYSIASLAPGGSVAATYVTRIADPLLSGGQLRNEATVTASSLAGTVAGERSYADDTDLTLTAPFLGIAKGVTPSSATVGEDVTYSIDVTIPAGVVAYQSVVVDTLPEGVVFDELVDSTCTGCSPMVTATLLHSDAGTGEIAFLLGDLSPAAAAARVVTITYRAHLADVAAVDAGAELDNEAVLAYDLADGTDPAPGSIPDPEDFDAATDPVVATVTVVEPTLTIDKDVAGQVGDTDTRRAVPGTVLTYTITVANTGTSPAYQVVVTDTPDPRLTGFAMVAGPTPVDGDPSDGTLRWEVPGPIAPAGSVVITYSVTVPAGLDEGDEVVGAEIVNTADVPAYEGVATDDQDEDRDYRDYDDVTPDTVSVELDLASLGDRVWFDVDGDGVQDAGEPGLAGVTVRVTYLGPDGVLGGGDDEVHDVVTDANGEYLVEHLPGGQYRVQVDPAGTTLPAGMAPSFDLDGTGTSHVATLTLAEGGARRDADFGYTGTGSIGDLVWFDQDRDGTQDAGEPGLAGVDVTVTWAGPDGLFGTADDVAFETTTGADGAYLVDRLPAGPYTVDVDPDTLPTGFEPVTGNGSTLTLDDGQDDLDQDFGYAGTGSIGDRVWLDSDEDGVQDAGEPGLVGVTVTLTRVGGGTFTTTTGPDGSYSFTDLPPGAYVVEVTAALPDGVANTYDLDGDEDSSAPVTLALGQHRTDVDFGYHGAASIGDLVWWDLDADGVPDPGEPGLAGVTVTVTYFGADGVEGTDDDLTFTTTTAADGSWSVTDVPDGDYRVVATPPAGFTPTYDPDDGGVDPDGQSLLELDTIDLAQDFGFVGPSSIGDTVWLDLDGDGAQDPGEPGLAGVTVVLTWHGPAGDVELTTTTDADGRYVFVGLPPGSYTVEVDPDSLPDGLDPTLAPDPIELGTDEDLDTADFGYVGSSSIGDTVWFDRDGDGVLDGDEYGLAGVTVTLTWQAPGGDVTFTTSTDADGRYLFDGLPAGSYVVTVDTATLPAGFDLVTYDEDGGVVGPDSTTPVTLPVATDHRAADFGYRGDATIGDLVWLDVPGAPGVPGQRVDLTWAGPDGVLGTGDDQTYTTTTDADGGYSFTGLPDGPYQVTVVGGIADAAANAPHPEGGDPPAAANAADPDGGDPHTALVTIVDGGSNLDQDFGYRGTNGVGDTVWWDLDADGTQDVGEPGLAGVDLVVTWFGPDGEAGTADDVELAATTDADGHYLLGDLPDGTYSVRVVAGVPTGLAPSHTPGAVDLADGTVDLDRDLGFAGSGTIGDRLWLDLDGDGAQDPGEPGLPGVTVTLTWAGPDGDLSTTGDNATFTTTTDATGGYRFEHLPAGTFRVDLDGLPAGVTPTADPDGGADRSAVLELATGAANLDQDFGFTGSASLGDTVWIDVDGDGAQDAGEPGLPGVTVTVRSAGGDGVLGTDDDVVVTVVTDGAGRYLVEGLPPGATRVSYDPAALPGGLAPSKDLDGGEHFVTEVVLDPGDHRRDVDFAVRGTSSLDGVVWNDADRDGVRDPGEAGIGGVTVVVVWDGPGGPVTFTVVTGPDGTWSLPGIPAGSYTATIDAATVPTGLTATTTGTVSVEVPLGGSATVRHGFAPPAGVGGAGTGTGGTGTTSPLPRTGNDVLDQVLLAAGLVAAGAALTRRQQTARLARARHARP